MTKKSKKGCTIFWKRGTGNKVVVRIPNRGYVLEFPSYKAMRKAILPSCHTKKIKGKVK